MAPCLHCSLIVIISVGLVSAEMGLITVTIVLVIFLATELVILLALNVVPTLREIPDGFQIDLQMTATGRDMTQIVVVAPCLEIFEIEIPTDRQP